MCYNLTDFDDRPLRTHLERAGFDRDNLSENVRIEETAVPLLAFSHRPFDTRTACIVAGPSDGSEPEFLEKSRRTGAPLAFTGSGRDWSAWQLASPEPKRLWSPQRGTLDEFFARHQGELNPQAIYRAKTASRYFSNQQLSFVDAGVLDLVESEVSTQLCGLVERMVLTTREKLHMPELGELSVADAQWLVQANFWLLASRLLHDKQVPGFKTLDLENLDNVFLRVGRHYGSPTQQPLSQKRRRALIAAASILDTHSSLQLVSTETLAKVYENVLITKETRKELGTHSTPSWLVNYMVHRLTPWLENQGPSRCHVYEPGCGHAPFLVALLRQFTGMKPCISMSDQERHDWLKARLCGCETDDFAREVARLSLTLADIPNPNGWELDNGNMFNDGKMESRLRDADIIISNPPFEPRESKGDQLFHVGQAAELLRRISINAKPGTTVAYIMPQTILDSKKTRLLRNDLLKNFEWNEILRLPDKVFEKADVETAILIGRKLDDGKRPSAAVNIRHVWDGDLSKFRQSGSATIEQKRYATQMLIADESSMLVPDLAEIWDYLDEYQRLKDVASVGHGLIYVSEKKVDKNGNKLFPKGQSQRVAKRTKGYELGFFNLQGFQDCHVTPKLEWLNANPDAVAAPRDGFTTGTPQIILNYIRIQRGPWRIKAFIDVVGHRACSDFLIVRPLQGWSLSCLWALLTSPIASAYTYSFSAKKHIYSSRLSKLPLPRIDENKKEKIEELVKAYLELANQHFPHSDGPTAKENTCGGSHDAYFSGFEPPDHSQIEQSLRDYRLRIDTLVTAAYSLPPKMERELLDYFSGFQRPGVPFLQTEYYPKDFRGAQTLTEFLSITTDWDRHNSQRLNLIEREFNGTLNNDQGKELKRLQNLATLRRRLVAPYPMHDVDAEIARLKNDGKWTE